MSDRKWLPFELAAIRKRFEHSDLGLPNVDDFNYPKIRLFFYSGMDLTFARLEQISLILCTKDIDIESSIEDGYYGSQSVALTLIARMPT